MAWYLRGLAIQSLTSRLKSPISPFKILSRYVVMKPSQPEFHPKETFEQKNIRLHRPLSPHVDIYAMRFQTALSLGHRVSGILLFGYSVLLGTGSLLLHPDGYVLVADYVGNHDIPRVIVIAIKILVALPFSYHWASGTRHLVWDFTGKFLKKSEIPTTGIVILVKCIIITSALLTLSFLSKPIQPRFTKECPNPYEQPSKSLCSTNIETVETSQIIEKSEVDEEIDSPCSGNTEHLPVNTTQIIISETKE